MNEPEYTAHRLQAVVGPDCAVSTTVDDEWAVSVTIGRDTIRLTYWPMLEEDDWSTGEHRVILRPSARPYRVESPRYSRAKTFAFLDHARRALLNEAMAVSFAAPPTRAAGPSGKAK